MKTLTAFGCIGIALAIAAPAFAQRTDRISVGTGGVQGSADSYAPSITADGRFVAFYSEANDLVPGDLNGTGDVFVRDRVLRTTELVSLSSSGQQGDAGSSYPSISPEGTFVAFMSTAGNLVAGDTDGAWDVFLRDLVHGTTQRISVDPAGQQPDGLSINPYISAGGRFVSFCSYATDLVSGDTNGVQDFFVRDVIHGTTTRVDVDANGVQADLGAAFGAISYDGHFAVFESNATNLVPGDTNGKGDVFVKELATGAITRVNVDSNGVQANGSATYATISSTGRYVVFGSQATNLVPFDTNGTYDVFLHDLVTGTTTLVGAASDGTQANGYTSRGNISDDGRYVAFKSLATNLAPGDTNGAMDIFVRDLVRGITVRVSVSANGAQGNSFSSEPLISPDGRSVAFYSEANNLVPFDTNGAWDVFVVSLANVHP